MQNGQAAVTGELGLFLSMQTKPKWQVVTSKNITWEICHARGSCNARRVHKLDFLTIFSGTPLCMEKEMVGGT